MHIDTHMEIHIHLIQWICSQTAWNSSTGALDYYRFSENNSNCRQFAVCYAKSPQLCPTLCNPADCSPPGSSVHGFLQARILEWVAISFSRGSSHPGEWAYGSCADRQTLYCWAAREAPHQISPLHIPAVSGTCWASYSQPNVSL